MKYKFSVRCGAFEGIDEWRFCLKCIGPNYHCSVDVSLRCTQISNSIEICRVVLEVRVKQTYQLWFALMHSVQRMGNVRKKKTVNSV
jgi:hypothetical protein